MHKLLRPGNPSPLLVDALTIVSQLARVQPSGGACNMYEPLLKSNLLPLIRQLLDNEDAGGWVGGWGGPSEWVCGWVWGGRVSGWVEQTMQSQHAHVCAICLLLLSSNPYRPAAGVRARTANLVGNMCRHSGFFYTVLQKAGVLPPLIQLCSDPDKGAR